MGECPDWYAWKAAATWLGMGTLDLEAHPDGLLWRNRAMVGMDAEQRAAKTQARLNGGTKATGR
jgi:hypothetical protein